MITPRVVETVPDSIRARDPVILAHIVQRDLVRASVLAVPDEDRSRGVTHEPALVYPTA
jgi:hypothetical protein